MRSALFITMIASALVCAPPTRAQTPGGAEIWDLSAPATPRHWFTGLTCRDSTADVPFSRRTAYDTTGGDVSCTYGRSGNPILVTLYMTLRRPYGASIDQDIDTTHQAMRQRYGQFAPLADGERTLATPQGQVKVRELIVRMGGQDNVEHRSVSGITGAWHADVSGWTLKLRLTGGPDEDLAWARTTADQLLTQTLADLGTARTCAGAGADAPPATELNSDSAMQLGFMAVALAQPLLASLPADAVAARRAGFICLGDAAQTNNGVIATTVLPAPGAASASAADAKVLALGEVRGGENNAMVAVVSIPAALLTMENAPAQPRQVVLSYHGDEVAFWRVADQAPRLAAAHVAAEMAAGASPVMSMRSEGKK